MILSFAAAFAAPVSATPTAVTAISWARPFTLELPERYTPGGATFTEGLLVELRADPALSVPRQVGVPVLYLGEVPAFRFNWDHEGGCVVAFVPGRTDLAQTVVFFGSDTLPERADGRAELAAAVAAGITPVAAAVTEPVLAARDLRDVHAAAMERVKACTATAEDLDRR